MESRKERREQKQGKRSKKKIIWTIVILLLVGIISYGVYLYMKLNDTVDTMYTPLESDTEKKEEVQTRLDDKDTVNVLLLGVDERENDVGRSDTMILLSLNPDTEEMLMFNIPRDTRVSIPGHDKDKINHAYAFGGSELAVQTAENFLDTTVHFYARINMEGLKDGVDAIGGVTVNNDQAFSHGGHDFPTGEITLNGEEALIYSRMRKEDPRGDLGRNTRQQQIINQLINEAMSFESFTRVDNILGAVGSNVQTNTDMEEMRQLFLDYRGTREETIQVEIDGTGQRLWSPNVQQELYYYVVSDQEKSRIRNLLEEHMNEE
ncbi:LCP family glycopolymer transferase [Alkalibacillus salilacus]|uniref:LCP family protein required for cell wall assembly n=1 Tax=Alkalibacillus salilacus TaxID=284582 RepID=A0ABT9VHT5_9BACI|nr:LCP family protein [Alkalibacillus salilacus]MDQ0160524.1 LCP family protein required for cell wall assembly [Alkalibacillus salilacus]